MTSKDILIIMLCSLASSISAVVVLKLLSVHNATAIGAGVGGGVTAGVVAVLMSRRTGTARDDPTDPD